MISILVFCQPLVGAQGAYKSGTTGNDVSWPPSNCMANPPKQSAFGIVGATGGLNFTPNPCLAAEAHRFEQLALYINTGYPGPAAAKQFTSNAVDCAIPAQCTSYRYGYAAAQYAMLYAISQNTYTDNWWLDVETENSWSSDAGQNRASIQGAIDAISQESLLHPTVGVYSTPLQWQQITGGWKNNLPNWVGTGSSDRADAIKACRGSDFTGGGTQLTQYILQIDQDYSC